MKRQFKLFLLMLGLSVSGSLVLSAQESPAIAKVPFDFRLQGRSMPQGTYTISKLRLGPPFRVTEENGTSLYFNPYGRETADPDKPVLTFACYGKECVLASLSLPGGEIKYTLNKKQIENNLTRKLGVASMISVRLQK